MASKTPQKPKIGGKVKKLTLPKPKKEGPSIKLKGPVKSAISTLVKNHQNKKKSVDADATSIVHRLESVRNAVGAKF